MWTLSQAAGYRQQGLWPVPYIPQYIEDMFQTWLYTGNGSTQTINNGIDLAGKGGLVWRKSRTQPSGAGFFNQLVDTARGVTGLLYSNTTDAQVTSFTALSSFNSNGFTMMSGAGAANQSGDTYASWTFRKQPKFFDVVTWTGDGTANRNVAHSLGSAPGFVIIKRTSGTSNWCVAARLNSGAASFMMLNRTVPQTSTASSWFNGTTFKVGTSDWPSSTGSPDFFGYDTNGTGDTYVAYLFAHNAGGFGLTGTDNVISCGSYTGTGATLDVSLGYEAQWVLIKPTTVAGNWTMMDNMRGMTQVGVDGTARLRPNTSEAESSLGGSYGAFPNATGFTVKSNPGVDDYNASGQTYIYIAIRRGPMKVPTDPTKVFVPTTGTASVNAVVTTGFATDMVITAGTGAVERGINDRLRGFPTTNTGIAPWLVTQGSAVEANYSGTNTLFNATNTTFQQGFYFSGAGAAQYSFLRAPGFFDEVCYTGTGSARTVAHNLAAVPELIITKRRDLGGNWNTYSASLGNTGILFLDDTSGNLGPDSSNWNNTSPTASVFTVGTGAPNLSSGTYVAYLFATCPGVSKVGSYTGTGATQVINCGFTGGARFVLIKATSTTGNWLVWDSARGIVAGNDPYLALNSTAAEVTNTDWVDTAATGFELSNAGGNLANVNGGAYIFLAIA
jgi:hypothetical protein